MLLYIVYLCQHSFNGYLLVNQCTYICFSLPQFSQNQVQKAIKREIIKLAKMLLRIDIIWLTVIKCTTCHMPHGTRSVCQQLTTLRMCATRDGPFAWPSETFNGQQGWIVLKKFHVEFWTDAKIPCSTL